MMRIKTIFSEKLKCARAEEGDGAAGEVRRDELDDRYRDAAELRGLCQAASGEVYST